MDTDKIQAIENLIRVFARDFPRRNHIIIVDMTTGSYRVDEMLSQEIRKRDSERIIVQVLDQRTSRVRL